MGSPVSERFLSERHHKREDRCGKIEQVAFFKQIVDYHNNNQTSTPFSRSGDSLQTIFSSKLPNVFCSSCNNQHS